MTEQDLEKKKRQAAFTVCKEIARKRSKEIDEIFGDFKSFVDYTLWMGSDKIKRLDAEKYNEHQVINYLCQWYRALIGREINSYYSPIKDENTISLESLVHSNGEDDDLVVVPDALTEEVDYSALDEKTDLDGIMDDIKKILTYESVSHNHRGVDYRVILEQLNDVNWSPTEASKKYGGSKSLWNQRTKHLIVSVADIIRDKYPSYVEALPRLVGSTKAGRKPSAILTAEAEEMNNRNKRKPKQLNLNRGTRSAVVANEILSFLSTLDHPTYVQDIVNHTGISKTTIGNACKFLVKVGMIDRTDGKVLVLGVRERKTNFYSINENGKKHLKEVENV